MMCAASFLITNHMKVKDAIEKLSKMNPDFDVMIYVVIEDYDSFIAVRELDLDQNDTTAPTPDEIEMPVSYLLGNIK